MTGPGELVHEARTDFVHLRVRDAGHERRLLFVEPDGLEVPQSAIDRRDPTRVVFPPVRDLLDAIGPLPGPARVLVLGLGGGALVHALRGRHRVAVVEIDPVVVEVAGRFFDLVADDRMSLHVADARDFLTAGQEPFDAIVSDLFGPADEDASDLPALVAAALAPGGRAVFNLARPEAAGAEHDAIAEAFSATAWFPVAEGENRIVVAR